MNPAEQALRRHYRYAKGMRADAPWYQAREHYRGALLGLLECSWIRESGALSVGTRARLWEQNFRAAQMHRLSLAIALQQRQPTTVEKREHFTL